MSEGGGAVWRCGGVDGRSNNFDAWIPVLKINLRNMEVVTSESV
jgi:hypothetical protein